VHKQQHESGECQCEVIFSQAERERREKESEKAFESWYQEKGHDQISTGVVRPVTISPSAGMGPGLTRPNQMPMMSVFPSTQPSAIGLNHLPFNPTMSVGNGGVGNGSYPNQYTMPVGNGGAGNVSYSSQYEFQYILNQCYPNIYSPPQYGTNQYYQNQGYPNNGSYSTHSPASNEKYGQANTPVPSNYHPSINTKVQHAESQQHKEYDMEGIDYPRFHGIVDPFRQVGPSGTPVVSPRRMGTVGVGMSWYPGNVNSPPPCQSSNLRRIQTWPGPKRGPRVPNSSRERKWKDVASTGDQVHDESQSHPDVPVSSKGQKIRTPVVGSSVVEQPKAD
jgi:hypothetical protein